MRIKPVIMLGNGGHAKVLTEILLYQGRKIIGYTAPCEKNICNIKYLGTDESVRNFDPYEIELVNAIGSTSSTSLREKLFYEFKSKGYFFSSVIHPSSIIDSTVKLGEGVQIMAGSVIQPFVEIADNTIINTSSSIDHECRIGKHCHISPGTTLSGGVLVGDGTHIGVGTTVIQNIKIGKNVLVGAGSLVIKDITDDKIVYGTPAKEVMK